MPRRPRPASRAPPKSVRRSQTNATEKNDVHSKGKSKADSESEGSLESDSEENEIGSNSDGIIEKDTENYESEDGIMEEEEDADVPRVAQWLDEDELGLSSGSGSESNSEDEDEEMPKMNLEKIQENLSNLPLGALRKAQYTLGQAEVCSESEPDDESNQSSDGESEDQSKRKRVPEWSLKPKSEIPKRHNKHAPTEISSKRPVTRRRQVVEVKNPEPRDPRFLAVAGEFSTEKYQNNYGFLSDTRRNELNTLKETLKRARKMMSSSPRDQRGDRASEVKRLELAVKRMESLVNKDRQDKIQMEALHKAKKEEREKRKQGKQGWWMKEAEKKKVVMEARYEALAEAGGKRAVKKAIEKRQKKIGQREKRRRPEIREDGRKRRRVEGFPSPSAQSLSSSSASLPRAGLGALAAVVDHAIVRWARRRGLPSSSSSSSSLPSRSSASLNARSKFTRYGRDTVTFLSSSSEREFSAHVALVKARKAPRQVPRQFILYLPPALLSERHRPDLPHGFTTTTSLSLIIGQLDLICRHPLKTCRTRERGPFEANCTKVNSASSAKHVLSTSGFISTKRDRKGKNRANSLPAIVEQDLSEPSQKAWYLDVASPSWEDLREIGKLLHLHPLTLEDILQNEPREKLELFPKLGYYFISFRAIETRDHARNTGVVPEEDPIGETNVYLTVFKDGICCFHFSDIAEHTDRVRVRIQRLGEVFNMSADWIAHGLLDSIVDSFFPYMDQIDKDIVAIDRLIFSRRDEPPANDAKGSPVQKMDFDAHLEKDSDMTGQYDQKFEITSEKMDFEDNNHRIRYSISFLTLNLLRCFRRPTSRYKTPLPENLSQNSKITLRRIARVRRMVTLLSRLLATKSEVIAQIRKRFRVGARSNLDARDIAMHIDDVQDHILTLQYSLAHYERILSELSPIYLSQLRTDLAITKSGEDKALLYLTSVTIAGLCIQSCIGVFSVNVHIPHNNRVPSGSYRAFAVVLTIIIIILIVYTIVVCQWCGRIKRRHRVKL